MERRRGSLLLPRPQHTCACAHLNLQYDGFEESLWLLFSKGQAIDKLIEPFKDLTEKEKSAANHYYDYIWCILQSPQKSRNAFYHDTLAEACIKIEFGSIDFGANAAVFHKGAEMSMHMEHLMVLYSVELFLKVHVKVCPKDSPLAGEKLEILYRHSEAAIPLIEKLNRCAKDDGLFTFSTSRRMLPIVT